MALLSTTVERMKTLVEDKDRLLGQKNFLTEELQHRVRNNLQLVYGMLSKQLGETGDAVGQRGIKAIARRVRTLAQVYDYLDTGEMPRAADFGSYLESLCRNIEQAENDPERGVTLVCDSHPLVLDLDAVTALGIVASELITNCYDHAFPRRRGAINVSLGRASESTDVAIMTIRDDGIGFTPVVRGKRQGIGLVLRLIEQVRGTSEFRSDGGASWIVRFRAEAANVEPRAPGSSPRD